MSLTSTALNLFFHKRYPGNKEDYNWACRHCSILKENKENA